MAPASSSDSKYCLRLQFRVCLQLRLSTPANGASLIAGSSIFDAAQKVVFKVFGCLFRVPSEGPEESSGIPFGGFLGAFLGSSLVGLCGRGLRSQKQANRTVHPLKIEDELTKH